MSRVGIETQKREALILPAERWRAEINRELVENGVAHDLAGLLARRVIAAIVNRHGTQSRADGVDV